MEIALLFVQFLLVAIAAIAAAGGCIVWIFWRFDQKLEQALKELDSEELP